MRASWLFFLTLVPLLFPALALCEPILTLDGFVDSYLAHDKPAPPTRSRSYTTQALYHDEPYLNLASGGITFSTESLRARAAAQWGSSVAANYRAEPSDSVDTIQEGFVGYKLGEESWLDAGVFLSHLGPESWLSKDNLTYTRSFIAEFSPYYEAGIRFSDTLSERLSAQLFVVRGWQNISDDKKPALGTLVTYKLSDAYSLTHTTFLGNEEGTRFFSDISLKGSLSSTIELVLASDIGYENRAGDPAWWSGSAAVLRKRLADTFAVSCRAEYFSDPKGTITTSNAPDTHFSITGLSAGIDYTPRKGVLLRAEYRPLFGSVAIIPRDDGFAERSHLIVVSVATWVDAVTVKW